MLYHAQKTLYCRDLHKIATVFLLYSVNKGLDLTVVHKIHKILKLFKQVFIYKL